MAVASLTEGCRDQGQGSGELPKTDFGTQPAAKEEASAVEMGQENMIALLLQQQEEVLMAIRDQKEKLTLSQENKQEIARLVLLSLKKQRLRKQPTAGASPHQPLGNYAAKRSRTSTKCNTSKRSGKKFAVVRRRQKDVRSSQGKRRGQENQQHPHTTEASRIYQPRSSHDQNLGGNNESGSNSNRVEAAEPLCFPDDNSDGMHNHREDQGLSTASLTLIRQRVENQPDQVEVSLDGLWLPSLASPGRLGDASISTGRRRKSSEGGSTSGGAGHWAESSTSVASYSAALLSPSSQAVENSNRHFDRGRRNRTGNDEARPATVDWRAATNRAPSYQHQRSREEGSIPTRSRVENPRTSATGKADGNEMRDNKSTGRFVHDGVDDDSNYGARRLIEQSTRQQISGCWITERDDEGTLASDISQDTAAMLKRSQALVAKAKACCGQEVRSSTADYSSSRGYCDGLKLQSRGHTSGTLSSNDRRHEGRDADTGLTRKGGGSGAGEAEAILYASSTSPVAGGVLSAPLALDDIAEENSLFPPPSPDTASATVQRDQAGVEIGVGSGLKLKAPEGSEVGVNGTNVEIHHSQKGGQPLRREIAIGGTRAPEHQSRELSDEVPTCFVTTGDTKSAGLVVEAAGSSRENTSSQEKRLSLGSSSSVIGRKGRSRGGRQCTENARNRLGESVGGGNPAKIDSEWENEIAKNILSLYQTKLKADLNANKDARAEELVRRHRGYRTIEEEEDIAYEQQLSRHNNHSKGAAVLSRVPINREHKDILKPRTAVGTNINSGPHRLNVLATTKEPTTPGRTRGKDLTVATRSPSSHRPVTVATKPSDAVIGRVSSLQRQQLHGPNASVVSSGGMDKPITRDHVATAGGVGAAASRGGLRGRTTISVPTRRGGEAVVLVPKRPRPIWFAGSGAIQAEWSALPGGERVVRDLEGLEEQGRYAKYVAVVEGLLTIHLRADDQRGPSELVQKLWRQLVATCIAFGVRSTENRRFERALELLKRAAVLLSRQALDKRSTSELQAFVYDAYGLYFLRRGKSTAALDFVQKAMKTHARMRDWGHVTKCHLHSSVVLSKLNRHDEALRCLGQVLSMVQEGKLDVGGNSPQKLCLVAICYHNMAVEQLILRHAGEACMSSQNARRLARLCLSYSNRWLHSFEGTHKLALAELARTFSPARGGIDALDEAPDTRENGRRGDGGADETDQRKILKHLTEELFT